mgnify:CR=1 FL=1|tara:strand:+ start:10434 stop:10991 length:558 start_codon:yes stop_codon:yes gene_type:complete
MNKTILSVLKSIEEYSKNHSDVFPISFDQGNFLAELITSNKASMCLELGVSHGYSTIFQAHALKGKGKLIAIEMNSAKIELATKNLKKCELLDVVDIKWGSAQKIIPKLNEMFDIVFMDHLKDQYVNCFDLLFDKIKINGIIVADNMLSHQEECLPYQDYVRSHPDFVSFLVPLGNGFELSIRKQ